MATKLQYQSFADAAGDSESLKKLKALRLPSLVGLSFLDVGCNEGFFCGYAKFAGAAKVVGLDSSEVFIERARRRFPDLQFLHQSWDHLPSEPFDVILLASALHYASDPANLLERAVRALNPNGTLVVELGVAKGEESAWIEVDRGADTRLFPTWPKVTELLSPYAWKRIADSVSQKGDPVSRYALHVNARKPVAYLLMQPPGYGKTTFCRTLFEPVGVPVVSGDQCLLDIAHGHVQTDSNLQELVRAHCDPNALDRTTRAVLDADLLPALVNTWLTLANGRTFALDSSLPMERHGQVEDIFRAHGFLVVTLNWKRPGAKLQSIGQVRDMADAYFAELPLPSQAANQKTAMPFKGVLGAVTQLAVSGETLEIVGWAVHENGGMPAVFGIKIGADLQLVSTFDRVALPQLQRLLGLPHMMYGYRITIPLPPTVNSDQIQHLLQVYGGLGAREMYGPLRMVPNSSYR